MTKPDVLIGIDPGVTTGLAVWSRYSRAFVEITSATILEAMALVDTYRTGASIELWFEDARLRNWFGEKGSESLQGAGSIKRDCAIWEEFCLRHRIDYRAMAPRKGGTKWDAEAFRRVTGWGKRTNEHSRDAAVIVWGAQ